MIGVARTWACRRTRQTPAPFKHLKRGGSWPSRRWVGSIIGTNVAPPEPCTAVQLSHSNKLLYCRLIGVASSTAVPADLLY
jgi:hypothetical protein